VGYEIRGVSSRKTQRRQRIAYNLHNIGLRPNPIWESGPGEKKKNGPEEKKQKRGGGKERESYF